jgi:hypothetical protein
VQLEGLTLGADPERWSEAGFAVGDDGMRVGEVSIAFGGGRGLAGWRLAGAGSEIDGLPVGAPADPVDGETAHPNGVVRIDHLVVFTPDLERTTGALEAVGVERRRVRETEAGGTPIRQGFFRLGEVILEVVDHADVEAGPARFWGITFAVADLDAAADLLGERLGTIRDAVQPGRRIATVRREADLGLPVAMITDEER